MGSSPWAWHSSIWPRFRPCPRRRSAWASIGSNGSTIAGDSRTTRWFRSWAQLRRRRGRAFRRCSISRRSTPPTCRRFRSASRDSRSFRSKKPGSRQSCVNRSEHWPGYRSSDDPGRIDEALKAFFGVSPHDEFFAYLGHRFTIYNVATRINAPSHVLESLALGLFRAPKMALVAEVKHRDLLAKSLEKMIEQANEALRAHAETAERPHARRNSTAEERRNRLHHVICRLGSPDRKRIAAHLAPWPEVTRSGIDARAGARARDLAENPGAAVLPAGEPLRTRLDGLPDNLIMLSVADTAHSVYPELIVGLPGFAESIVKSRRFTVLPIFHGRKHRSTRPFCQSAAPIEPPAARSAPVFDAELVPDPDDLRPFLFPSVHALVVDDAGIRFISREAIPTLNPSTAVPIALAALVPSLQSAQAARGRAQSTNNLKQIGLALHNFHSANDHFPADIRGKDGKPLLSWRVSILPFIEQQALFQEFHQDEPWDSPHNKALIARMPATFSVPDGSASRTRS